MIITKVSTSWHAWIGQCATRLVHPREKVNSLRGITRYCPHCNAAFVYCHWKSIGLHSPKPVRLCSTGDCLPFFSFLRHDWSQPACCGLGVVFLLFVHRTLTTLIRYTPPPIIGSVAILRRWPCSVSMLLHSWSHRKQKIGGSQNGKFSDKSNRKSLGPPTWLTRMTCKVFFPPDDRTSIHLSPLKKKKFLLTEATHDCRT